MQRFGNGETCVPQAWRVLFDTGSAPLATIVAAA
jgi:hypothetical protein